MRCRSWEITMRRPHLTIRQILRWADAFFAHWARWPTRESGAVTGAIDVTWCGINIALRKGNRGLPGGSSLAQLLAEHRGVRNRMRLPRLTIKLILAWIDAYHKRTGQWPTRKSGKVVESPGDTWRAIDVDLRHGSRGLRIESSLARVLARYRGVRNPSGLPRLAIGQILQWADAYHRRTGRWPTADSGPIPGVPGETWFTVANALFKGYRGLRRDSLAKLLQRHRGVRNRRALPRLTIAQILAWADAHFGRTGQWPIHLSGPVFNAPGETWGAIHVSLQRGARGLRYQSSLYEVLRKYRGVNRTVRNATRGKSA
jgi:hypothetical protein